MALSAEPTNPLEREQLHLPPKSYAEAAEEALAHEEPPFDEDAVKESPPRFLHFRNTSEPRPFGEVMDEPTPGSPSLRHPKGRLENKGSRDSYAEVVKEHNHHENDGQGATHMDEADENNKMDPEEEADETFESQEAQPEEPASTEHVNGTKDEKKIDIEVVDQNGNDAKEANDGELVYENFHSKSGENLASVKPAKDYHTSMEQREDKPPSSEPPPQVDGREGPSLVSGRRAGAGWANSAIHWAPLNVPLQRRLQTAVVLMHTLSIVGFLAIFFVLCAIPLLWPVLVPYLLYVLLSKASVDGELRYRSEWLRSCKIWSLFGSYFPARLHRTQALEPTRKYIFGYHPHGIISHGAFAAFATDALGFKQLFPGITNTLLTLDSNFRIPLYRDYALRLGLASVSRESCENLLTKGGPNGEGMGRAITIVIGGARESLDALPYSLKLVLKRRKGFVKLAIRTGADLVPILSFGENDIYDQLDSSAHPYVHKAQMLVKKFMGFTVPLFHARGVFNYDVGIMPYRRPINLVVGHPIHIVQNRNPDPAYVDEVHARYIEELLRIWDDWKDVFARGRKSELELIE